MRLTRMILNTLLLGALAGIVMFPQSAASGHQQPKPPEGNEQWVPGTFHGIRVGKSTSEDVIRAFGKPDGKGEVKELVVPSDKDGEIEYQYLAAPGVDGYLEIIFGKRSGVVTAILLYPEEMTRADAITKFGADFEESDGKLGPCPSARERKLFAQYHNDYGVLLVYRKLGLYVAIGDIKKDDTVLLIAYLRSCR